MPIFSHCCFSLPRSSRQLPSPKACALPTTDKIVGEFHCPHTQPGDALHRLPNARPEGLSARAAGIHPTIPAARLPAGFVKIRHFGLYAAGNVNFKLAAARADIDRRCADTAQMQTSSLPPETAPRRWRDLSRTMSRVRSSWRSSLVIVSSSPVRTPTSGASVCKLGWARSWS